MTPARAAPILLALASVSAPASAETAYRIDLPAGRLGDSLAALGRQTGTSVSVADARLWRRSVPAVRGSMSVRDALDRLLRGSGARPIALGGDNWRIAAPAVRAIRPRPVPPPAPPLDATPPSPEDEPIIVVTASKRDVALRDYPGAASVMSGADLAFGGERGTEAILSRLASVSSTHLGAGRNKLFIRGIADSSFTGPTQATVGQYLGDVRLSYNAPDPDLRLYDIASVEVLEGPQGTLYGAGSLGGIIRIVRNPPRLGAVEGAISAGASLTAHGDPGGDAGGTLNLPLLGERAALRVVGYGVSEGGYIDDALRGLDDINRTRIAGGRLSLRVDAGDGWTIDLGGTLQDTDGDESQYADRGAPPLTRRSRLDQGFTARYRLADLVIDKQWDDLRFTSSTGYVEQRLAERFDASLAGDPERLFRQNNDTQFFSTENRLARPMTDGFGWVIGGSYMRNRTRLNRALGPVDMPTPVTGVTNRVSEATLFGEASVVLLRGLTLTGGGRFTRASLTGGGEDVSPLLTFAQRMIVANRTETAFLPSVALSAAVRPGLTMFARYQQGFRPGGLAIESDFVRRFRNDRVATLEAGVRYGAPGRDEFDFSATVAHTRWDDIQADFIDGIGFPSTANIGDGRIYSIAATGGWRPLPGLNLDAGFAFNDSRVTEPSAFVLFAAPERMGQIPNVAEFAGRLGFDYQAGLNDDLDLRVAGWARYVGQSRLGIGPVLGEKQGDYLDTALNLRVGRPSLGVTLGVSNLTDSVGNRFALGTPFNTGQPGQITPLRPRTIRLGLDAAF